MSLELPIYVVILKEELNRRTRSNPAYSLRSFAKSLELDPSLLSKILQNSRALSPSNAIKIMERVKLPAHEKSLFWQSYIAQREKTYTNKPKRDDLFHSPLEERERFLEQKQFTIISEPYHYLIVELSSLKNFQSDYAWIGKVAGISAELAQLAVERLIEIGMLERNGDKIRRGQGRFTTKNKQVTDGALKYHQRKVLEKAASAMDTIPLERRNQSSMTIAINPEKIPLAKELIQDFINQLSDVLETGEVKEVYQISLSLFPLTHFSETQPQKQPEIESIGGIQ